MPLTLHLVHPPQLFPTPNTSLLLHIAKGNRLCLPHPVKTSGYLSALNPMLRPETTSDMPSALMLPEKLALSSNRIPQVIQVNTGWAIRAVDKANRDLLLERQADWAEDLGATAVETSQKWYTYAVGNCPRRLADLYGNELNYDVAVHDEISNQTGLTPVSIRVPRRDNEQLPYKTLIISFLEPTKRPWSLFGTSRLARLIERTNPPKQCENCWDYHTRHACNRQARCKRCGKTEHISDSCTAPEQCANCLGPHTADLSTCPARPRESMAGSSPAQRTANIGQTDGLSALPTTPGCTTVTGISDCI